MNLDPLKMKGAAEDNMKVQLFGELMSMVKQALDAFISMRDTISSELRGFAERITLIERRVATVRDGKDYVITAKDREDIAKSITIPVVEKIVEKTTETVIREVPTVTVNEVPNKDTAEDIRNKLELFIGGPEEDKLKIEAIGNLRDELEKRINTAGTRVGWGAHPLTVQGSGITVDKNTRFINFTGATVTRSPSGVVTVAVVGGSSSSGTSVLKFAIPTGTVNGVNTSFTITGQVVVAGSDDGSDAAASLSYNSGLDVTTITYTSPPQNNVFALVLSSTNPTLTTPTGSVNGSNTSFTVTGRVTLVFTDRVVDVGATFSYAPLTNTTTITTSIPPQNNISALVVVGFPISTQTPTCTTNSSGLPDGVATQFSAVGQINAAIGDSGVDVSASLSYDYANNLTNIIYSVPPQNNVSTF